MMPLLFTSFTCNTYRSYVNTGVEYYWCGNIVDYYDSGILDQSGKVIVLWSSKLLKSKLLKSNIHVS